MSGHNNSELFFFLLQLAPKGVRGRHPRPSIPELAALLKITPAATYKWIDKGWIPDDRIAELSALADDGLREKLAAWSRTEVLSRRRAAAELSA
jgi:hypothetical protein